MNVRTIVLTSLAALSLTAGFARAEIKGDYVEARTASVFAGPCHYNGEVVTTGREAVLAWNVAAGDWKGVDLAGVRAVAVVTSDANLSDAKAARKAELIVDASATDAQATAIVEALKEKAGAALGEVVAVKRAAVTFAREGDAYAVKAGDVAVLDVKAMPDAACCKQPSDVWYAPLVTLADRKVGFTAQAKYAGGAAGGAWQRAGENSAFYGSFTL